MRGALVVAVTFAALALAPKIANAQSVTLACDISNSCFSEASGLSYDTIFWTGDSSQTDAIFPANCTNQNFCNFYCLNRPGLITLTVNYSLGGQIVGAATAQAQCSGEPY